MVVTFYLNVVWFVQRLNFCPVTSSDNICILKIITVLLLWKMILLNTCKCKKLFFEKKQSQRNPIYFLLREPE